MKIIKLDDYALFYAIHVYKHYFVKKNNYANEALKELLS